MGKKGSWFIAVKKAFSPSKDADKAPPKRAAEKEANRASERQKKIPKEKKRWNFGRTSSEDVKGHVDKPFIVHAGAEQQSQHALAIAAATAAAAEAAVVAAQAAAEVVRLTGGTRASLYKEWSHEEQAALKIQAAFRGYLARRALRALKGLVRLQALVRGHTVRRQATIAFRCMQTLERVQARVRERRASFFEKGQALQKELWQKQQLDIGSRRSWSETSHQGNWDDSIQSAEEVQAKLQQKQDAAIKRERALAYALSHQLWKTAPNADTVLIPSEEGRPQLGCNWLDRWMAGRTWDGQAVEKDILEVTPTKVFEEKTLEAGRLSSSTRSQRQHLIQGYVSPTVSTSALKVSRQPARHWSPDASATTLQSFKPVTSNIRPVSPQSAQTLEEDGSFMSMPTTTRSLHSVPIPPVSSVKHTVAGSSIHDDERLLDEMLVPSYMLSTQSARAKTRSQSTPKQRVGTPEKESLCLVKKRLSFPAAEFSGGPSGPLKPVRSQGPPRSPNFKGHSGPLKLERLYDEL